MKDNEIKAIKERERKFRESELPFGEHVLKNKNRYTNIIELKNVSKYLEVKKDDKLLDVGCADGRFFEYIKNKFESYCMTGIDFAKNPLLNLKRKKITENIVCGDICNLPFKAGLFDKGVSIQTLQQVPSQKQRIKVLKNLNCALTRGGKAVITVLNQNTWFPLVENGKEGQLKTSKNLYIYLYNSKDFYDDLREAGFYIKRIVGINNIPGRYLKKLSAIGVILDIFITCHFKSLSIKKGTYLLAKCEKK